MIEVLVASDNEIKKQIIEHKNITLLELAEELNIDVSNIGAILVNNVPKKMSDKFEDNATVYFLPILQGG